jgi:hypothetical protein
VDIVKKWRSSTAKIAIVCQEIAQDVWRNTPAISKLLQPDFQRTGELFLPMTIVRLFSTQVNSWVAQQGGSEVFDRQFSPTHRQRRLLGLSQLSRAWYFEGFKFAQPGVFCSLSLLTRHHLPRNL